MKNLSKKKLGQMNVKLKYGLLAVVGVSTLAAGSYGWDYYRFWSDSNEARAAVQAGFPVVAAARLQPHSDRVFKSTEMCELAIQAFSQAGLADAVDRTAQECTFKGFGTPVVAVGLGMAKELRGDKEGAAQTYRNLANNLKESPLPLFQLAKLYEANKKTQQAEDAFLGAFQRAPGNQNMVLEVLKFANRTKAWQKFSSALVEAEKIETDDPSIMMLIADGYRNLKDEARAKSFYQKGEGLLAKRPASDRQVLESIFPDLFAWSKGSSTAGTTTGEPPTGRGPAQNKQ